MTTSENDNTLLRQKSALRNAVYSRDADAVKVLLDEGADPNTTDTLGRPVLVHAVSTGQEEVASLLLDKGADPDGRDPGPFADTALMKAVPSIRITQLLLQRGANVNGTDANGRTALMAAAYSAGVCGDGVESLEIAKMLLDAGADVNAAMGGALRVAASHKGLERRPSRYADEQMCNLLLSRGANANLRPDTSCWTALICAAAGGHYEVVMALLTHGADVNAVTVDGTTALMQSARTQNVQVVRALIESGADVNARRQSNIYTCIGGTPLMEAVLCHVYDDVINTLIKSGADVNARTEAGRTALSFARKRCNTQVIRLLRNAGAKDGLWPRWLRFVRGVE